MLKKSYNNKISLLFSSHCLIADQIYNIIQILIKKFLCKNRLPSKGQRVRGPQLGYKKGGEGG